MPGGLSTDLYELTMAAGYHAAGRMPRASFELFVRALPPSRGFLVAAGLEQALDYLESWRFTPDDVAYLRSVPALAGAGPGFFDEYLPRVRFTGDVEAIDEGVPVFAGEPLLRVTAPLAEAQLVETALLSTVLFQTMIASKAARVVEAAEGRAVIEFGGRRAHGAEAAMLAARAACLAGFGATSNLDAGCRFGLPVSGTMAHSWVMAQPEELTAFRRYVELHGPRSVLLIDTYDPLAAARSIVEAGLRPGAGQDRQRRPRCAQPGGAGDPGRGRVQGNPGSRQRRPRRASRRGARGSRRADRRVRRRHRGEHVVGRAFPQRRLQAGGDRAGRGDGPAGEAQPRQDQSAPAPSRSGGSARPTPRPAT